MAQKENADRNKTVEKIIVFILKELLSSLKHGTPAS